MGRSVGAAPRRLQQLPQLALGSPARLRVKLGDSPLDRGQLSLVPLEGGGVTLASVEQSFRDFRGEKAACFKSSDRERLLAIIEASFGAMTAFDEAVRGVFTKQARQAGGPVRV